MKKLTIMLAAVLLAACGNNERLKETDLSKYFKGIDGTAVFYNPAVGEYKVYNRELSQKRSSPCSTFKIMSSYIALAEDIATPQSPKIPHNGNRYQYPQWNKNMNLQEAFKTSCVWYFRALIDRIPPERVKDFLRHFQYGNQDISDWRGDQNTNTDLPELKGFWIESSLQISPLEQVQVLARLFREKSPAAETLKNLMLVADTPVKIYGKTGLGIKDDRVRDAWFVGFCERDGKKVFFAVRLNDSENPIADYRHQASRYAKEIALDIIKNADIF